MSNLGPNIYSNLDESISRRLDDSTLLTYANYPLLTDLYDVSSYGNVGTMTRASSKTVIPTSSSIAVSDASSNTAGFTGTGAIVQQAHTNILSESQDFTTTWNNYLSRLTITGGQTDPSDGTSAMLLECSTTVNNYIQDIDTILTGNSVTISFFAKKGSVDYVYATLSDHTAPTTHVGYMNFDINAGVVNQHLHVGTKIVPANSGIKLCKNGYYYCWASYTTTSMTIIRSTIYPSSTSAGATQASGNNIYLYQADLIQGSLYPLSPITTSGLSGICEKDDLTFPSTGSPTYPVNDFVMKVDYIPQGINTFNYIYSLGADANNNISVSYNKANNRFEVYNYVGGVQRQFAKSDVIPTVGTTYVITLTNSSTLGLTLDVNGTSETDATVYDITTHSVIVVGARYDNTQHSNAEFSDFTVNNI